MKATTDRLGEIDCLDHPALGEPFGDPVAEARCTDRAKLAALLEGAALLSLCEVAGWSLAARWSGARVDERGRLSGVEVRRGRDPRPVQVRLGELLRLLFRSGARIAGRGVGRRAARELAEPFSRSLVPMSSDDAIGLIFQAAPFLWEDEFRGARETLAGGIRRGAERTAWVAGPPAIRRQVYARSVPAAGSATPAAGLAAAGRWSEAVRRWQDLPPANESERLLLAESLYALGRFETALLLVAQREDSAALALRAGCRLLLGELAAAREAIDRLAVRELTLAERLDFGDLALRVLFLQGEIAMAGEWAAKALAAARGPSKRARAHLLAATAALDGGNLELAERHFESARPLAEDAAEGWRWHEAAVWLALEREDGEGVVAASRELLRRRRRRMRRFEAGRAWNNLGLGHLIRGEFATAERAFERSARLLRRCDGPLSVTLPQANLAEVRLRQGKLLEVEPILRATSAHNRRSGNRRGLAVDELLWARFELVAGRPEEVLERAERSLRGGDPQRGASQSGLAVLATRAAGWLRDPELAGRWLAAARDAADREDGHCAALALELDAEELPGLLALAGEHEAAREAARTGEFGAVWHAVLRGDPAPPLALGRLAALSPFRRARMVLDLERVLPGATSAEFREEAARQFRRLGAARYAALLETGDAGVWSALRRCLEAGDESPRELAALFGAAGHPEADLRWRCGSEERIVVGGSGAAPEEISAAAGDGIWILRASEIDEPLRALFALVRSDGRFLAPCRAQPESGGAAGDAGIVGQSPALLAALGRLHQFAGTEMPVLLLGESGTGKELAAREVLRASRRARGPWVTINCAALSETLLLSDLFGHARGAFTGADRIHVGVFESAHGGTVFLDEIGDLPPVAQGNLLRVLQEGEIRRLGETQARKVDVRLIAATHRDLPAMVRDGRFRQDLYFRLKVCTVEMPPLRERGGDVDLLVAKFLERAGRAHGGVRFELTAAARRRLASYAWPGNVRELSHVLEAAAALARGGRIDADDLDLDDGSIASAPSGDYHRAVDEFRRALLLRALSEEGGNRAAAARRLGISRQALFYLVRQLGLADERPAS
ncbi:MAG: sigma 54-interacting transcriptional regulator [Thermoanaerobaculia bacterium]